MSCRESCCVGEYEGPEVTFESYREPVARKRHTCSDCGGDINAGTRYRRRAGVVDGEWVDDKWHYGMCPEPIWKWTCRECGASGPMPADILTTAHDCKSRGPFDAVASLLVEPDTGSTDPDPRQRAEYLAASRAAAAMADWRPTATQPHAVMCNVPNAGTCAVPWCTCTCHNESHDPTP